MLRTILFLRRYGNRIDFIATDLTWTAQPVAKNEETAKGAGSVARRINRVK
jgi:hypothetical protein